MVITLKLLDLLKYYLGEIFLFNNIIDFMEILVAIAGDHQ